MKCGLKEEQIAVFTDDNTMQAYIWNDNNWKHDDYEHTHQRSQLSFVEEGYQYFHIQDKIHLVPQNHAIWIPSGVSHRISSEAESVHLAVVLFKDVPQDQFYHSVQVFPAPSVLREMLAYAAKWSRLLIENPAQQSFLQSILSNLHEFCEENRLLEIPVPTDHRLIPICSNIDSNYMHDIRIEDYAEASNMSVRNMQRLFKKETGLTIQKYIQLIRILKSVELISSKKYTLTQIAFKVGYKSLSAYSSSYKSIMKTLPKNAVNVSMAQKKS